MPKRVLITGGCGFIGHHVVEHILKNTDWEVVVWDKLSYASGGFDRLRDIDAFDDRRVTILGVDFSQPIEPGIVSETGPLNYILHLGAETHVDRSIRDAAPFVTANVMGTLRVLEYARDHQPDLEKFVYFSTDEVFGPAPEDIEYDEWDCYRSSNPYAASKAGGEEMAIAFENTHGVPVIVTHTMNAFGERQHPEKFIPMVIRQVRDGEKVTIHANADRTEAGSRFYIHARNVADALLFLLDLGEVGDKYNIVGEQEVDNLDLALTIALSVGNPLKYEMVDFHSSRPGHDLRYALDGTKMSELGWEPPKTLQASLAKTVRWMLDHPRWLEVA
jgi:dTDP-glucose 4,6-dehydratase